MFNSTLSRFIELKSFVTCCLLFATFLCLIRCLNFFTGLKILYFGEPFTGWSNTSAHI